MIRFRSRFDITTNTVVNEEIITKLDVHVSNIVESYCREGLFIFRELGSTATYLRGAGEQAHTFGDLGSTANFFLRNKANVLLRIFYYNAMGAFFKH